MSSFSVKSSLLERSDRELLSDSNNSTFCKSSGWNGLLGYTLGPIYDHLDAASAHAGCLNHSFTLSSWSRKPYNACLWISKYNKLTQNPLNPTLLHTNFQDYLPIEEALVWVFLLFSNHLHIRFSINNFLRCSFLVFIICFSISGISIIIEYQLKVGRMFLGFLTLSYFPLTFFFRRNIALPGLAEWK